MERDVEFMREALLLAKDAAAAGEVPVGCVVTQGDRIVGRGKNSRETGKNALGHAELAAIDEACRTLGGWRLWQCTLYVTLEPCPMCAGAIINARIPRIVYGAADKKAGVLTVKNIWFEEGIKQTKKMQAAIEQCIRRFAKFNECTGIIASKPFMF